MRYTLALLLVLSACNAPTAQTPSPTPQTGSQTQPNTDSGPQYVTFEAIASDTPASIIALDPKYGWGPSAQGQIGYSEEGFQYNMANDWTVSVAYSLNADYAGQEQVLFEAGGGRSIGDQQIGGPGGGMTVTVGGTTIGCSVFDSSGLMTETSYTVARDTNTHVVTCVLDKSKVLHIWIDGTEKNDVSDSVASENHDTTGLVSVGKAAYENGEDFSGSIVGIGFWTQALTSNQISSLTF